MESQRCWEVPGRHCCREINGQELSCSALCGSWEGSGLGRIQVWLSRKGSAHLWQDLTQFEWSFEGIDYVDMAKEIWTEYYVQKSTYQLDNKLLDRFLEWKCCLECSRIPSVFAIILTIFAHIHPLFQAVVKQHYHAGTIKWLLIRNIASETKDEL